MNATTSNHSERLLRRAEAAKYVVETYNVPCSPKTLGENCLHKFGGAALPIGWALSAVSGLGPRHLGAEEDRPPGPVNVRSPHRRLSLRTGPVRGRPVVNVWQSKGTTPHHAPHRERERRRASCRLTNPKPNRRAQAANIRCCARSSSQAEKSSPRDPRQAWHPRRQLRRSSATACTRHSQIWLRPSPDSDRRPAAHDILLQVESRGD